MISSYLSTSLIGVGVTQLVLGMAHVFFKGYFKWKEELAGVNLLTRQIFYVHTFFIAFVVSLFGLLTILCYEEMLTGSKLALFITALLFLFWAARLIFQFWVYSPALWRGQSFRTAMHILFSLLWIWMVVTYGSVLYYQVFHNINSI